MKYLIYLSLALSAFGQASGEELIEMMHKKYAGKWYKNLTFKQETIFYTADTVRQTQTWHEALSFPGLLHVKFGDPAEGNGMFFAEDSQYVFQKGQFVQKRRLLHPLLILGFDVYFQSAEKSIAQLKELKFDLSVIDKTTWQGREVYMSAQKMVTLKNISFG